MKNIVTKLFFATTLLVTGLSTQAEARRRPSPPRRVSAPELSGKAAGTAAVLLAGVVLVAVDRRRRRSIA